MMKLGNNLCNAK